jgi:hypothetical protein
MSIVRATPKLDVVDCRLSTNSVRLCVMELQKGPLDAAAAVVRNECALAAVACPDLSSDLGGNVPRAWIGTAAVSGAIARSDLVFL